MGALCISRDSHPQFVLLSREDHAGWRSDIYALSPHGRKVLNGDNLTILGALALTSREGLQYDIRPYGGINAHLEM